MVTIIPKTPQKSPVSESLVLYISIGLLAAAFLSYFLLAHLESRSSEAVQALEEQIEAVGADEARAEILAVRTKMEDFSLLVRDHRRPSNFFDFLEEITHPRVGFLEVELSPPEFKANLVGFSTDFKNVAQQIYLFQEQELIEAIKLNNLTLGDMGEARFSLELFLSPELLK